MDISSYLAVGGWFIQVIFDKYLSYKLRRWAANCGIDHELDRLRVALLRTQSMELSWRPHWTALFHGCRSSEMSCIMQRIS